MHLLRRCALPLAALGGWWLVGAAPAPAQVSPPKPVTLEWVGDIALSTQRGLPPGGLARARRALAGFTRSASTSSISPTTTRSTTAPPGAVRRISALSQAGVAHTGLPGEIGITSSRGRRTRSVPRLRPVQPRREPALDLAGAQTLVRRARGARAGVVVVMMHAGAEGQPDSHTPRRRRSGVRRGPRQHRARSRTRRSTRARSLVLGSGPHVVRGVERYRRRLIAYSLGNFVGTAPLAAAAACSPSARSCG